MARCSQDECETWRPDVLVRRHRVGYRLDNEWYCSRDCLEEATRELLVGTPSSASWPNRGPRIGALLLSQRAVTEAALRLALQEQEVTHLPLGRQLEAMGLVAPGDVLRALSTQAGVGYLSTVDVSTLPEVTQPLSSATLRELDLIPIEVDTALQRFKVASRAPVPWPALHAIYEVTGWTAEPLLVSDADWQALSLRTARNGRAQAIPVASVEEAVEHTADLAHNRHTRDISVARVDPYILVRVEGRDGQADNTLFHMTTPQEEPCRAASM